MDGYLLYLYCFIPSNEIQVDEFTPFQGIDNENMVFLKQMDDITAIVSYVSKEDYAQTVLDQKFQDPNWVEEKGRHHHHSISSLNKDYTVIPMSLCTIFNDEKILEARLIELYPDIVQLFEEIKGNEEWNLKIYFDDNKMKQGVLENNHTILSFKESLENYPKGKQFFMRKKLEKMIEEETEKEIKNVIKKINDDLKNIILKRKTNKIWPKHLTGRSDEMAYNGVYLLSKKQINAFKERIQHNENNYKECGWVFEFSGPWPPYHFSSLKKEGNDV